MGPDLYHSQLVIWQTVAKVVKFFMVLAFFREYTISSSSRSILIQIVMAILLVIFVTSKKNKMVLKKRKHTHTHTHVVDLD